MPYILIKTKHFGASKKEEIYGKLRSIEHVLEKKNRSFRFKDADLECEVDVINESDALYISKQLGLKEVIYISDDNRSKDLEVIASTIPRKQRVYIKDVATGKSMSLKQLKKQNTVETLSKNQIIKMGVLTKKELETALAEGKLEYFLDGNTTRVLRKSILEFVRNKQGK